MSDDPSRVGVEDDAVQDATQTGEAVCPSCGGSGELDGAPCPQCAGTGRTGLSVGDA